MIAELTLNPFTISHYHIIGLAATYFRAPGLLNALPPEGNMQPIWNLENCPS